MSPNHFLTNMFLFELKKLSNQRVFFFVLITDEGVVSATFLTTNSNEGKKAVLYSAPQPVSSDTGCLTMSYLGQNVHLKLFITPGTEYTRYKPIFERQDVKSKLFTIESIQTPTDTPYMVLFIYLFIYCITWKVQRNCYDI